MTYTADKLGEKLDGGWSTALWYQGYLKLPVMYQDTNSLTVLDDAV